MPNLYSDEKDKWPGGKKQCMGCMEFYGTEFDVCPHCGYEENQPARELLHIDPGTELIGRYIVGRALGYGGFGVTYIGWDTQLKRKVAIKEYLPSEFATRMIHHQDLMVANSEKKRQQFLDGMKKFLQEGQKLAQVSNIDGIVRMYDSFEANNTAYIVMEYLDGETLASYLEHTGQISEQQALDLIMPVLQALEVVHEKGIIHRDIAPDNIFLATDQAGNLKVKLIDFGAAKFATTSHSKSLTVIIKPGYSPEEQYRSNGDQGPYTDVYAIAAVLYRMVTGVQPPDAFERRTAIESKKKDLLVEPGQYNKDLSSNFEIALLNAMNVRIEDRTATVADFEDELISFEPVKRRGSSIRRIDFMRWPLWAKISVPLVSVAAIALVIFAALKVFSTPDAVYTLPDGMTRVPDFVTANFGEAQQWASDAMLLISSSGSQYAPHTADNIVLSQDVSVGSVVVENTAVSVLISTGQESYSLPDVTGMLVGDARDALECMGLEVLVEEGSQPGLAANSVIAQSIEPYSSVSFGETISLTVTPEGESGAGQVPNLVGLTYEEALSEAAEAGISLVVNEKIFSKEHRNTEVIAQNLDVGAGLSDGAAVEVTIALEWREFSMPNLMFKSQDIAVQLLKNICITADITEEISEVVSRGLVFEQSIEKDTTVQPGGSVSLSVSKGSTPFAMPNVEGMLESEAREILTASALAVSVEYGYDANVEEGRIISQSIIGGEDVTRGTAITITVCSTEGLTTVEDVTGLSVEEAIEALTAQGLQIQKNEIYSDTVAEGNVIEQLPAAGSVQKNGTIIVLTVSKGVDPATIQQEEEHSNSESSSNKPASWTWSDWSTSLPAGTSEYETKTQYRFRTRETTSSSEAVLSGWTLYDTTSSWSDYGAWSEWSTTPVNGNDSTQVETMVQYRYQDKVYTTATDSSLSGWTQTGSSTTYGDWGSWSSWGSSAVSSSDTRDVETATIYGYYYFACPGCGARWHGWDFNCANWQSGYGCGTYIPEGSWNVMWSTTSWSNASLYEWHGTGHYATDIFSDGRWFQWSNDGTPRTGYRYRDRSKTVVYSYEKWGDWSDWSTGAYTSSDTRNVESRTIYRYRTRSLINTYYFERWSDWSGYSDAAISPNSDVEVQTRAVYRYKIYS